MATKRECVVCSMWTERDQKGLPVCERCTAEMELQVLMELDQEMSTEMHQRAVAWHAEQDLRREEVRRQHL